MGKIYLIIFLSALAASAEVKLGKPLKLKQPQPIAEVVARPDPLVGKTLQVKGKITAVCQMMGCWMNLVDPATGAALRVKVDDGVIEFPKDGSGKLALAEGKLEKIELSKEQAIAHAKHEAEEQGRPLDPASVNGPTTTYQLRATGAVVLD